MSVDKKGRTKDYGACISDDWLAALQGGISSALLFKELYQTVMKEYHTR